jgi:hypothetical protein
MTERVPGAQAWLELTFCGEDRNRPVRCSLRPDFRDIGISSSVIFSVNLESNGIVESFDHIHIDIEGLRRLYDDTIGLVKGKHRQACLRSEENGLEMKFGRNADQMTVKGKITFDPPGCPNQSPRLPEVRAAGLPYPRNIKFSFLMKPASTEQLLKQLKQLLDHGDHLLDHPLKTLS